MAQKDKKSKQKKVPEPVTAKPEEPKKAEPEQPSKKVPKC